MRNSVSAFVILLVSLASNPAAAMVSLGGTIWDSSDCWITLKFTRDNRFVESDLARDHNGSWRFEEATLILKYDDGKERRGLASDLTLMINYGQGSGSAVCEFRRRME